MKHPASLLVGLTLVVLIARLPAASAAESLIPNGDLEQVATAASGVPSPMTVWNSVQDRPVSEVSLSTEEKTSGENSLHISRLDEPKGGVTRVSIRGSDLIPVEPGKRYFFSCQAKCTQAKIAILIKAYNSSKEVFPLGLEDAVTTTQGAMLGYDGAMVRLQHSEAADPEGFNKVDLTFTVPADAVFLSVEVDYSHNANGKAWFDDFELLPLE